MKSLYFALSIFMVCVLMMKLAIAGPLPTVPTAPPTPPSGNDKPYNGPPTLATKATTPKNSSPEVSTVTSIYPTTTPKRRRP